MAAKTTTTTTTTTTIEKYDATATHTAYNINAFNHRVRAIVTRTPSIVASWISHIQSLHPNNHHQTTAVVGLDTEWLNPIATLQLCIGPDCLIYQLLHSHPAPVELKDFLADPRWKFSGVGVAGDAKRLAEDYGLEVACTVDVSRVAAEEGRVRENAGLREVAREVLGWEVEKHRSVTMSRWDNEVLDEGQVKYACIDAFVSFHIARALNIGDNKNNEVVDHKVLKRLNFNSYEIWYWSRPTLSIPDLVEKRAKYYSYKRLYKSAVSYQVFVFLMDYLGLMYVV